MVVIERETGQAVQVGPHLLKVLAIRAGEVILVLLDPEKDCLGCGDPGTDRFRCSACGLEALRCPACLPDWTCPRCSAPG
jgi:hypothetical protein